MTFDCLPDSAFDARIRRRTAVRLLLVDDQRRVLLLRHDAPIHDTHWSGCGGGVEGDETDLEALRREVSEELTLPPDVLQPEMVGPWRYQFNFNGDPCVQTETIYTCALPPGVAPDDVQLGPDAATDGIGELKWFTPDEIARCEDDVWPTGLAEWLLSQSQ